MNTCALTLYLVIMSLGVVSCNLMDPTPSQRPPSTRLHKAVYEGDIKRVRSLAGMRSTDLDQLTRGRTALAYAVTDKNYDVANILLSAGANPDVHSVVTGLAPIHDAAAQGDLRMVKLLVEYGSDPRLKGKSPNETWTPVSAASIGKHRNMVAYLVSAKRKN